MIHSRKLFKLMSLFASGLVALLVAPSTLAVCECMCVDAAPMNVCTGFLNSQETTAQCTAELSCTATEEEDVDDEGGDSDGNDD